VYLSQNNFSVNNFIKGVTDPSLADFARRGRLSSERTAGRERRRKSIRNISTW